MSAETKKCIAFSGLPVESGVGMARPIWEGDRIADELGQLEQRGLVTLMSDPVPGRAGYVVLHAHLDFMLRASAPTVGFGQFQVLANCYVWLLEKQTALQELARWAEELLEQSYRLSGDDAFRAVLRARSCAFTELSMDLRHRTVVELARTARACGRSVESVWQDASLEFSRNDVDRMKAQFERDTPKESGLHVASRLLDSANFDQHPRQVA